jgi:hypothetical protein
MDVNLFEAAHASRLPMECGRGWSEVTASSVRISPGNGSRADPDQSCSPIANPAFYDTPFYRPDPWATDAVTDLDPDASVLLVGTGLTTVARVPAGRSGRWYYL